MSLHNDNKNLIETVAEKVEQQQLAESSSDGFSRRGFLKVTGIAGGGLVLAMTMPSIPSFAQTSNDLESTIELNAFVRVGSDGKIQIYAAHPDIGQGVKTALPMIVAEELGVKWEDVDVLMAPIDDRFGRQGVGGSTAIPRNFQLLREMGASAREMFIGAAADAMNVPRDELKAENSRVVHSSGKSMSFAELAKLGIQNQPVPDPGTLKFKDRSEYTILGSSDITGIDNYNLVNGNPLFGVDISIPEMKYAAYHKCPSPRGKVVSANLDDIKKLPGITDAFLVEGNGDARLLLDGVAIIGTSTWAVFNAKQQLEVEWDYTTASKDSWTDMVARAEAGQNQLGDQIVKEVGNVDNIFADAANKTIQSHYQYPFISHICLEPMNCTADYRKGENGVDDTVELWPPHQFPARAYEVAEQVFGMKKEQVQINPVTRVGGSFGRRVYGEYISEAIAISKQAGVPVKLTWTREDCMRHDFFRAGGFQTLKAALNPEGKLVAWQNHFVGITVGDRPASGARLRDVEFPMLNLDHVKGTQTTFNIGTPCGPLRAPSANATSFVVQSFIHELALAAGRDHLEFLLEIMGEPRWFEPDNDRSLNTGRAADVIKLAAEKAGWGKTLPAGQGLGLAFHFSHRAHVAEVAHVSVDANKKLKVHKVTVAVDVGPIINMSGARSQIEGSVVDGLSGMVGQKITMENGEVEQTNFHEYPVLRIPATPEIDIHFIESEYPPTGLGEPALPPLVPAVANAIYAANGDRVRHLPLTDQGYSV